MMKPTALTFALAVLVVGGAARAEHQADACSRTSKAARRACLFEASDDFWIARGNCNNLSADADRSQCTAESRDSLAEAKEECVDQFGARQELCDAVGQAPYDPVINPANFPPPAVTAVNPNPYFPLIPGTEWVYEEDGTTVTVTVTDQTKEILGVTTIVVRDVEEEDGEVIEDTEDWFAQDVDGNVWYFGEISKNLEGGELVDIEGSWKAGVDGAKPGIIMQADPTVGDVYRQEFALGDAEDAAEVTSTTGTETVPAASCEGDCVVTKDFSPLEPDAEENKFYAPDVGLILEVDPESGDRLELVSFTSG